MACRWDITGPPAVRAARLMQYAIKRGHDMVIDHSIFQDRMASTRLLLLHKAVQVKGTKEAFPVYTLSNSFEWAALRILETEYASVLDDKVEEIRSLITARGPTKRAMIITGPALSAKKIAAQRAAGYAGMIPYLHVSSESAGYLQLASTIAMWFKHVDDIDMQTFASDVLHHLQAKRWSRAHDACIDLMNLAVVLGLKACFVVDRVHFLDEFSMSLIRECFRSRRAKNTREQEHRWSGLFANLIESENDGDDGMVGRVCFLCIHVSLYRWSSAQDVKDRISGSHSKYDVPVIRLGQVSKDGIRNMCRELVDLDVSDRWLEIYSLTSGYCAGYCVERMAASRVISGQLWLQKKKGLVTTNDDLMIQIPGGMLKRNRDLTVHEVSAEVAMKFTQIFDENPPLFQVSRECKSFSLVFLLFT